MKKIFLIIAIVIASFAFAEEVQPDFVEIEETETIEYIEQPTDSIERAVEDVGDYKPYIKEIENGVIIIIYNGVKYTVTGQRI